MNKDQSDATMHKHKGLTRVFKAGMSSMDGLGYAFKEAAFRLELLIGTVLIAVSCFLSLECTQHLLLIGSVLLVLIVEVLNSALEAVVDDISYEIRPLAKQAKDLGSAAVFIALLNCGLCWAYILFANWEQLMG